MSIATQRSEASERADAAALVERGAALCRARRIGEAESVLLDAQQALPTPSARVSSKLAIVRLIQGRLDEAEHLMRLAVETDPGNASLHSKLIALLAYHPASKTAAIKAEQRRWDSRHSALLSPQQAVEERTDSRLRIGYVARDFGAGSVARVYRSILTHADRDRFAVYCYSGTTAWDLCALDLCFRVDAWRTTAQLDDDALAARIRRDGIDVLVDLDGHTDGNRLAVFSRRPAPMQLSGWGYLPGPGISAITGVLTDAVVIPSGERSDVVERCFDLPCAHAYDAPAALDPGPPPCLVNGFVTMASFNRVEKIGPAVCDVWSTVLHALDGSRLVLMDAAFADAQMRANVLARFACQGIAPDRIELRPRYPLPAYLAAYRDIDIALDPWPHSGGMTTLDALWMGVPVITRTGQHPLGRTSASILTCLGLAHLIAANAGGYVDSVLALARAPHQLALLRGGLRRRLERSPIGNAAVYARAVEAAYLDGWARRSTRVSSGPGTR